MDIGERKGEASRSSQKNLSLLKALVWRRYKKHHETVVDCFGGTFTTAKACLELPKHPRFVGCEFDSHCVQVALPEVLDMLATQLRSRNSDIDGDVPALNSARDYQFLRKDKKLYPQRLGEWKISGGLLHYQRLPPHICSFIATLIKDRSVLREAPEPVERWSPRSWRLLNITSIEVLWAAEAFSPGFVVLPSPIAHKNPGMGVFAAREFNAGDKIVPY